MMMNCQPNLRGCVPMDQLAHLSDFFPADDLEWRIGPTTADKRKGMALCYVTNRAIQDRLDYVCGPANWRNEYRPTPNDPTGESVLCGISILVLREEGTTEWVTKWDASSNTDVDPVKGGLSSSMKRAGVQWGIGRYLYTMPSPWVAIEPAGKSFRIIEAPRVPPEFLPQGADPSVTPRTEPVPQDADAPAKAQKMTLDQADEINALLADPFMPEDEKKKYLAWLRKPHSRIMADKAIERLTEIIAEQVVADAKKAAEAPSVPQDEPEPAPTPEAEKKAPRRASPPPAAQAKPKGYHPVAQSTAFSPGTDDELPFN